MPALEPAHRPLVLAGLAAFIVGFAAIAGAWAFEYAGLTPCPLCLQQRWPYYIGLPLALPAVLLLVFVPRLSALARLLLALTALLFLAGGLLGVYHAGVEWAWWPGPADCSGGGGTFGGDLVEQMRATRIVPCNEAAWRMFGISLAGYNAAISLAIAAAIGWAMKRGRG